MAALPKSGEAVDLQEWVFRFVSSPLSIPATLDVGTEFLFGTSSGVLHPQATALGRRFAWTFNLGVDGVAQRIRLGRLALLYYNANYASACKMVHDYVDPIAVAALEKAQKSEPQQPSNVENDKRYTFLAALVREDLSPKKISDHMLNILIAARDTSACLMSAAFFELARQPAIQAKIRAEVERQLDGRLPNYDDLKNMTYLNWFIKETLRLYPPIPMNIRVANKDTFLPVGGGPDGSAPIFVPAGQEVAYQIFSTHRRKDLWGEDADQFRPERWEAVRPHFQYLPFNAGPRICPGQQFALLETSYVIVRFLQECSRLEGAGTPQPWTENYTLTCSVGQSS
ncbi:cytochrome P450 [Dactylonectria macrodidyma]|uniref:Cytochrome P450 n=1 Tax=Dactylonectria macrodidyma TaxID=307937 RepID=A0A9P9J7G0_9HYPO|nr:cytochrome P450 [Dactylonectria macrodidyma]